MHWKNSLLLLVRALPVFLCLLLIGANAAAQPVFPTNSIDARSLGRGGTGIASPGGVSSVLGNPATLRPVGAFSLGLDYLADESTPQDSFVLSLVDTNSTLRGGLIFIADPEFAGFEDYLWGVALAQSLGPSLFIGQNFHMGKYQDPLDNGSSNLSAADIGLVWDISPMLSLGYVARNLYRSDRELLEFRNGLGLSIGLPWTIFLFADYEESSEVKDKEDLRAGIQFSPLKPLTARIGYQDLSNDETYCTVGLSFGDRVGSLDIGASYSLERDEFQRIILGVFLNK